VRTTDLLPGSRNAAMKQMLGEAGAPKHPDPLPIIGALLIVVGIILLFK
jgi:hypothetical protein